MRPDIEEIFSAAPEFVAVVDNIVSLAADVRKLPGLCTDGVSDLQQAS